MFNSNVDFFKENHLKNFKYLINKRSSKFTLLNLSFIPKICFELITLKKQCQFPSDAILRKLILLG